MLSHVAKLFSSMLSHGHSPECLNMSTLIPIPKDGDICCSDNYRGIALSSCVVKLMEIILMSKSNTSIATSELQFAYKAKHSTSQCTLLLKETVNYYLNRNSDVYGCLIDASKAFDRIQHDKLFKILLERNVPICVVRFLLNSYGQQQLRVRWRDGLSDPFGASNGVKQGGIFSPVLFCLYIDILLDRLKALGVGCHIGNNYLGALSYADDLTLLSPCIYALKRMLTVCENFANEFNLMYNPKKSQCIHFTRSYVEAHPTVHLCTQQLKWFKSVKHLGNIITFNLDDTLDTNRKIGDFFYHCNSLKSTFKCVTTSTIVRLFNTYCTVFYGSQTWNLKHPCISNVCTKFNRGTRMLFGLPYRTHRKLLPLIAKSKPPLHMLCHRFQKMLLKMSNSLNYTIQNAMAIFLSDPRSISSQNLCVFAGESLRVDDVDDETKANASLIVDIIDSRFSSDILTRHEIEFLLVELCTN